MKNRERNNAYTRKISEMTAIMFLGTMKWHVIERLWPFDMYIGKHKPFQYRKPYVFNVQCVDKDNATFTDALYVFHY